MNTANFNPINLFDERKETLLNSFKAIYEKIITNNNRLISFSPSQLTSYIESVVKNISFSEREQFIFYLSSIITNIANSVNMKVPEFVTHFQEDIQEFNKKYDNDGQLSKLLFKYFSNDYSPNKNKESSNQILNNQKFNEIPKIQSFFPHLLGFSYEALLMRAMLFDLRTIIVTTQNSFSLFIQKAKQKINDYYQKQKKQDQISKQNVNDNELILKEREKVQLLKKNFQIMCDENDKFKLKVEGEIIKIINIINSLSSQGNNNYQITLDELNKQSKKLIKMIKNDSNLNNDYLKSGNNSNSNIENAEKLKLIKELKEKNDTILNLRAQLNDLKVEILRNSLNKTNTAMKSSEIPQNYIGNIEYYMASSVSSKSLNKNADDLQNNEYDMITSDLDHNNNESFNDRNYELKLKSRSSGKVINDNNYKNNNDSSLAVSESFSTLVHNQENISYAPAPSSNNHKYEIEELKKQLKQSKSLIDQLTDQNKKKDKTIHSLNQRIQDSSSKFDILFDKIHILKKKNKTLKKARNSNNDNRDNISTDSSFSTSNYCCTRESLLVEQISERTSELIFKDSIIIELENENRKLQTQIEMMKENNSISSRQVLRLKDDIKHIQNSSLNDLDMLSKQLNEKQNIIRELADKVSEFEQIKDKSEKYQKLKIMNKKLNDKYQSLLSEVNKNQIEVQKVFEINKLKNENLKNKYSSLKEKYEKNKKVNQYLTEQNQKLMREIELLQKSKKEISFETKIESPLTKQSDYQCEASSSNNQSISDSFNNLLNENT